MTSDESLLTHTDLVALVESGRDLATQVELQSLLEGILSKAAQLTDSPDASVILYNEQRNSLYFAGAIGEKGKTLLERMGEASRDQVEMDSIAGQVFQTGASRIVCEVSQDPGHSRGVDDLTKKKTRSMVCVPLDAAGGRLGVVQLLNKRGGAYSERDRVLLEHFAAQAGVAIRNANLLQSLVAHMGLYGGPGRGPVELVKELNRPVHEEEVTIMFADLRGFTRLCQDLKSPARIQRILDELFCMLSDEVVRHEGIVNKFLGDGMLALFRDAEQSRRAVLCAFKIVERFEKMGAAWDEASNISLDYLGLGVGIATGPVMIGPLGGKRRRDFTVFGETVNLAAVFQAEARSGKFIYSDHETYLRAMDLVEPVKAPETSELKSSDQPKGQLFKRYHLRPRVTAPPPGDQVFLSHNSMDKPAVRELATALKARQIRVWLDEWELVPGRPWQDGLEEAIKTAKSAAVIVGKDGLGPWEIPEMRACLSQFVGRRMPVIPVLLPGAPDNVELPLFLKEFTWVDLRRGLTEEGLDRLQWGVTGRKPGK
jgi:class 3 adenylate cyclase